MDPMLEHVQRARRLIADLAAPAQPQLESAGWARLPNSGLNEDQELAVDRSDFSKRALHTVCSGCNVCHYDLCHVQCCLLLCMLLTKLRCLCLMLLIFSFLSPPPTTPPPFLPSCLLTRAAEAKQMGSQCIA